jgi:hypothetical protein
MATSLPTSSRSFTGRYPPCSGSDADGSRTESSRWAVPGLRPDKVLKIRNILEAHLLTEFEQAAREACMGAIKGLGAPASSPGRMLLNRAVRPWWRAELSAGSSVCSPNKADGVSGNDPMTGAQQSYQKLNAASRTSFSRASGCAPKRMDALNEVKTGATP